MNIELKTLTEDNKAKILQLKVNENQTSYIETVDECLKEAEECEIYVPAGLYIDDILVGFVMFGHFQIEGPVGRDWLDRFLIDLQYQGKGYARPLLKYMIEYLKNRYETHHIYLSIFEDNHVVLNLYETLGFKMTGELDLNGEKVMCLEITEDYSFSLTWN